MMHNDRDDMCDEEKSYHEWVSNHLEYLAQNKPHVTVMKKLYMDGFAAGFDYRGKIQAKEYLEK